MNDDEKTTIQQLRDFANFIILAYNSNCDCEECQEVRRLLQRFYEEEAA